MCRILTEKYHHCIGILFFLKVIFGDIYVVWNGKIHVLELDMFYVYYMLTPNTATFELRCL